MPTIRTTIFLKQELLLQADKLAAALNVSRDRIFEMAMEEYLRRHLEPSSEQQAKDKIEP